MDTPRPPADTAVDPPTGEATPTADAPKQASAEVEPVPVEVAAAAPAVPSTKPTEVVAPIAKVAAPTPAVAAKVAEPAPAPTPIAEPIPTPIAAPAVKPAPKPMAEPASVTQFDPSEVIAPFKAAAPPQVTAAPVAAPAPQQDAVASADATPNEQASSADGEMTTAAKRKLRKKRRRAERQAAAKLAAAGQPSAEKTAVEATPNDKPAAGKPLVEQASGKKAAAQTPVEQGKPPADSPAAEQETTFASIGLDARLVAAVTELGFEKPTAIQAQAIPPLLSGRDLIGGARTGSGKTAAFGLPLLERVKDGGGHRALVLLPTRELAIQVGNALRSFAKQIKGLRVVTIYGGAPYQPQLKALSSGVTVVVGTPGRVIDHMERGSLKMANVEMLVLDEADEMLRMGFIDDVEKLIAATPETRQVALFSATMPQRIRAVAKRHLADPLQLEVESRALTVDHIEQQWIFVPHRFKLDALVRLLQGVARGTTLVFARTRAACGEIAERLLNDGFDIDALHGDLSQAARERVMSRMRSRQLRIVVATDVAARGLDVEHIEHVVNFDMPDDAEIYVHRIGRTGRAGRAGCAISFVTPRERGRMRDLERRLRVRIEQVQVPTDNEIAQIQQSSLLSRIHDAVENAPSYAKTYASQVLETTDLSALDLAAAALALLARNEGVSLEASDNNALPAWAQPPKRDKRPRHDPRFPNRDEIHVELYFPLGKTKNIRPSDLVGLLANEAGIPGPAIGRINVFSHKSFVALPKSMAEHVLKVLPRVALRGIEVPITLARAGEPRPVADRPPRRPNRKPPKGIRTPRPSRPSRPSRKKSAGVTKHKRHAKP